MVNLSGFTAKPYGAQILCCTDVQDSAFSGCHKNKDFFLISNVQQPYGITSLSNMVLP